MDEGGATINGVNMLPSSTGPRIFGMEPSIGFSLQSLLPRASHDSASISSTPAEGESRLDDQAMAMIFEQLKLKEVFEELAAKEAAEEREKNTIRKKFPAVVTMMEQIGIRSVNGQIDSCPQLSLQQKEVRPPLYLMQKEKSENDKAVFLATIMQLITFELEYLQMSHQYNESATLHKAIQDFLVSYGAKFIGKTYLVTVPDSFKIDSTAAFAVYLRYSKKMKEGDPDSCLLTSQDQEALVKFFQYEDPAIREQLAFIATTFMNAKGFDTFVKSMGPLLARMQYFLANPEAFEICKQFTPALALLTSLDLHLGETLAFSEKFDPQVDPEKRVYLPVRKKNLADLCPNYCQKQIDIYKKAHAGLQSLLKDHPDWRTTHPLFVTTYEKSVPLPEPKVFEIEMQRQVERMRPLDTSAQIAQALEQEEDARIAAIVKKKAKAVTKKKKQKPLPSQVKEVKNKAPQKSAILLPESLSDKIIKTVQKPSPLLRHKRVTRWLKISPTKLDVIKTFKDVRDGQTVYQYAHLSDPELKTQLILHGFSPLIDKLLGNAELKKKYCYETPRGVALFVELIRENEPIQRGVLHLGIDSQTNLCFHRKIDLKTASDFIKQSYKQLAEIKWEDDSEKQQTLAVELASGFEGGADLKFEEKMEIISVNDNKLKCQINVFPLA